MQRLITTYIACALLCAGCVLSKKNTDNSTEPLKPGIHEKVMLTIQGPANADSLDVLKGKLEALPYILDVSITDNTGVITACLVPGLTYDIVQLQAAAKDAGYVILKAGKIVW